MYKVYKVVRRIGYSEKFSSCSPLYNMWNLDYSIGKETKCIPGTPGVFVFTSLQRARESGYNASARVLLCKTRYKPRSVSMLHVPSKLIRTLGWLKVKDAWSISDNAAPYWYPTGSHVVRSVTPIKEL